MNENKFLKIFCIAAFLAFAAVSCWATAESLHLLLDSWPLIMCWVVTIGFFFIASYGTKLMVDSLNKNIYMEKRGMKLIGGTILLLVFWLFCSMPTNTHTFFYRTVISDVTNNDIQRTTDYLSQIKENTNNTEQARIKVQQLESEFEILMEDLRREIMNERNPGFGDKSKEILNKFAILFGVDKIEPLSGNANTPREREALCVAYREKLKAQAEIKARKIVQSVLTPSQGNLKEAALSMKNLQLMKKSIDNGDIDLNDALDIKTVNDQLNTAYNVVRKNEQFVNFKNDTDKAEFTAPSPITKVKKLISVFDAWQAFLGGEFAGHGFGFWILISILVDVAAFIFFDIAFKKRDY